MLKFIAGIVIAIALFAAGFFAGSYIKNAETSHTLASILSRVQAMSNLNTMRYSYDNMIRSERDLPPLLAGLYGDSLIMMARGEINAGIDLSAISEASFIETEDTLTIRLPAAQLQECFFNEQESRVVSRSTGLFASPAPNLDKDARLYTIRQVRDSAIESEILNKAQLHAEQLILELVTGIVGDEYEEIRVISDPQPSEPIFPETCQ